MCAKMVEVISSLDLVRRLCAIEMTAHKKILNSAKQKEPQSRIV